MADFTEEDIISHIIKLSNLTPYRKKSEAELRELAVKQLTAKGEQRAEEARTAEITEAYEDDNEKTYAINLYKRYSQDYSIETVSDLNMLKQLIYLEVLNTRFQFLLNDVKSTGARNVPKNLVDATHANLKQILDLKSKLGLIHDNKNKSETDALEELKRKFKVWRENNTLSRTRQCPHCQKYIMFRSRLGDKEKWDAQKHPFIKDRFLYNPHLYHLLHTGKISKKDVALVLQVSEDYVNEIEEKVHGTVTTNE